MIINKVLNFILFIISLIIYVIIDMASSKKKGTTIHSEARNIIINVMEQCDEVSHKGSLKPTTYVHFCVSS